MRRWAFGKNFRSGAVVTASILALVGAQSSVAETVAPPSANAAGPFGPNSRDGVTSTPIKHVIIIIGENWSFDSVFATYKPKDGETVWNLLSEGIVNPDGTPGPSYSKSVQDRASDYQSFQLSPPGKTPYQTLPPFQAGGPSTPYGCQLIGITAGTDCKSSANVAKVMQYENGLAPGYYQYLLTGGTGQTSSGHTTSTLVPDARVWYDGEDASNLPPGVFQLTQTTHSPFMPYDAYAASPVHRLFQMWQELDCSAKSATKTDPSGCREDLFPWVESTVAAGSNGKAPPSGYIGEGSTAMLFLRVCPETSCRIT